MKKKLIVFGSAEIAELAHFYFTHDSNYDVVAFTVNEHFIKESTFCGLPVVAFENIVNTFPPNEYSFFVALSYSKLNSIRKQKYLEAKNMGYPIASYISSSATVLNQNACGENCFILEDNTIQPFVKIGNNVTLWSGNHIGHHSVIHDHCFIASHVVVSGGVTIEEQCFIGVNVTLRDHITIGERSVLGAGTLILSNVEKESLYIGSATQKANITSVQLRNI